MPLDKATFKALHEAMSDDALVERVYFFANDIRFCDNGKDLRVAAEHLAEHALELARRMSKRG